MAELIVNIWDRPEARCWIFASPTPLLSHKSLLKNRLAPFVAHWKNERHPLVPAHWQLLSDHFVVVSADESAASVSGCSKDALHHEITSLGRELGVDFHNRLLYYSGEAGAVGDEAVKAVDRAGFLKKWRDGELGPDTPVYDTTLTRLGDLAEGKFVRRLEDSWHYQLVKSLAIS